MDKFLKEYKGHTFDDWGSECSTDFKSFARKFKNYLTRGGVNVVSHNCNHYDLSGFAEQNGVYIYYSWSWKRFGPVDVNASGCFDGVLVRFAKNTKDFHGERNQFCAIAQLPEKIKSMMSERTASSASY